jgi:hypothetical protein
MKKLLTTQDQDAPFGKNWYIIRNDNSVHIYIIQDARNYALKEQKTGTHMYLNMHVSMKI